jgi:hypothetical protein
MDWRRTAWLAAAIACFLLAIAAIIVSLPNTNVIGPLFFGGLGLVFFVRFRITPEVHERMRANGFALYERRVIGEVFRTIFGTIFGGAAIGLIYFDLAHAQWLQLWLPTVLAAAALWMLTRKRKKAPFEIRHEGRHRKYLEANPSVKWLEELSKWFGRLGWLLAAAWFFYEFFYLRRALNAGEIVGALVLSQMPSLLLSAIAFLKEFRFLLRERRKKGQAP